MYIILFSAFDALTHLLYKHMINLINCTFAHGNF